ncbi:MAG: heavy-metal-associated domain-containing protein [Armatimonadetes bacterium]|nr:heavy-metal-associated domain-containing protein [Armatimonadota bacterium]
MKKTYETPAIHCHSCASLIRETLEEDVEGVRSVSVDVPAKRVTVEADDAAEARVLKALADLGYPAEPGC